jgi:hypothetical protein
MTQSGPAELKPEQKRVLGYLLVSIGAFFAGIGVLALLDEYDNQTNTTIRRTGAARRSTCAGSPAKANRPS